MSSAEKAEQEMRQKKLEALEKGQMTDFSFLIGQEKDNSEVS